MKGIRARPVEVSKRAEYCMYPQGAYRIRKSDRAGNGCANTEEWAEKIRSQSQTIYSAVPWVYYP